MNGNYNRKGLSKTSGDGLATAVKMCKTPAASDGYTGNLKKDEVKFGNSGSLAQEVESGFLETHRMWPTPTASEMEGGIIQNVEEREGSFSRRNAKGERWGVKLRDAVAHTEKMWPTPTTQEVEHPNAVLTETGRRKTKDGKDSHSLNLADSVKMWPTPNTLDGMDPKSPEALHKEATVTRPGRKQPANLRDAVSNMNNWPTPTVQDSNKATKRWRTDHQNNLTSAVFNPDKAFPTPTSRDYKGGYTTESLTRKDGKSRAMDALPNAVLDGKGVETTTKGMQLNPEWVEWLMGWPLNWTSLESLDGEGFQGWMCGYNSQNQAWWSEEPENVGRVASGVTKRIDRLKALGNGQVPICATMAWNILTNR